MSQLNRFFFTSGAIFLLLLASGCAKQAPTTVQPAIADMQFRYVEQAEVLGEDIWPDRDLRQAFNDYWSLRNAGNVEAIFRMEAPHIQEALDFEQYRRYFANASAHPVKVIKIRDIDLLSEHLVEVRIGLMYRDDPMPWEIAHLTERWVRVENRWYHVLRDNFFFRQIS